MSEHQLQSSLQQQRQDFLAVLNHRLRTPILANERIAALLSQGAFGPLTAEQIDIVGHLLDNNQNIHRLLDMLVDIYRYRSGTQHLNFQVQELKGIVERAVKIAKARHKGSPVNLDVRVETVSVSCDQCELTKLLSHLLENAMRYAKHSVQVYSRTEGNEFALSIEDDGIGMTAQDQSDIFDRFYQISSDGKYAAITGVGLCLCSEIVKAHRAKIDCRSTLGEGTTFIVTLPLNEPQNK